MLARATIAHQLRILVDDEQLAREELSYLLKEFPTWKFWQPDGTGWKR